MESYDETAPSYSWLEKEDAERSQDLANFQ
jgi:hypothetical protein